MPNQLPNVPIDQFRLALEKVFIYRLLRHEFEQLTKLKRLPYGSTNLLFGVRLWFYKIAEQLLNTIRHIPNQRRVLLNNEMGVDTTLIAATKYTKSKKGKRVTNVGEISIVVESCVWLLAPSGDTKRGSDINNCNPRKPSHYDKVESQSQSRWLIQN